MLFEFLIRSHVSFLSGAGRLEAGGGGGGGIIDYGASMRMLYEIVNPDKIGIYTNIIRIRIF